MSVKIKWLGHASFKISSEGKTVYIDPWKVEASPGDASVVLVSHGHYDHCSESDIEKVSGPETKILGPADVAGEIKNSQVLKPGDSITADGMNITGVPSYNPEKQFHPKSNNWLGFLIRLGGLSIYYAGDTDLTEEMKSLGEVDVALLPVGGTYTMGAEEAAASVEHIKPKRAIPYHWGDIIGDRDDAERFLKAAGCEVTVLQPGEEITI